MGLQAAQLQILRGALVLLERSAPSDIPKNASEAAVALGECGLILDEHVEGKRASKLEAECHATVHKLKLLITGMLQDRSVLNNLGGIILVKTYVETCGFKALRDANHWVRGLLSVLQKSISETTKQLCILTLLRIFLLSHHDSTIVRQLTTPVLPKFISVCLGIATPSSQNGRSQAVHVGCIEAVLYSFEVLLRMHTNAFRPLLPAVRKLSVVHLVKVDSTPPVDIPERILVTSNRCSLHARRIFVLIHLCAARNTTSTAWKQTFDDLIVACHRNAAKTFRCIKEDWTAPSDLKAYMNGEPVIGELELSEDHDLGFPAWKGISAGLGRLISLLDIVRSMISTDLPMTICLPLYPIITVVERILSSVELFRTNSQHKFHAAFSSEERDALFLHLPSLCLSCVEITTTLIDRFGSSLLPLHNTLLGRILAIFESERYRNHHKLVLSACRFVTHSLSFGGLYLSKAHSDNLTRLIRTACTLLENAKVLSPGLCKSSTIETGGKGSRLVLEDFLCALLIQVPGDYFTINARATIDRTAIITQSKKLMQASTLNPPIVENGILATSILPMFARAYPQSIELESLVRPQMPVVQLNGAPDLTDDVATTGVDEEDTLMKDDDSPCDSGESGDDSRRPIDPYSAQVNTMPFEFAVKHDATVEDIRSDAKPDPPLTAARTPSGDGMRVTETLDSRDSLQTLGQGNGASGSRLPSEHMLDDNDSDDSDMPELEVDDLGDDDDEDEDEDEVEDAEPKQS